MKILNLNESAIHNKVAKEIKNELAREITTKEKNQAKGSPRVDSSDISSNRSGTFADKRLSAVKSSILFDVSVKTSDRLEELKEIIDSGNYEIPSDLIAEEILK
jgi:anti-sigma28 factor (negative regulator of flagellin synthesis)